MSFPRYGAYKDSGVEWLGEVPGHWEIWKLTHDFRVIGSGTTPKTENSGYYEDGEIPWLNTGDLNDGDLYDCERRITRLAVEENSALKLYDPGAVVIAMYGATIGKLGVLRFTTAVNQACCVFQKSERIFPRFLFYWLLGLRSRIISLAYGGGQPNISQEILRGLRLACPAPSEQTAITAFLDRETAKVDALVEEQQRLIALLKEKRQAVICQAVTKGLDPDAPMKDSGVEWLGEVPAHWDVVPLMHLPQPGRPIMYGIVLPGPDVPDGIPIVKGGDVKSHRLRLELLNRTTPEIEAPYARARLKPGDIVYSIRGTIGDAELVPDELLDANITQDAARIAPLSTVNNRWLLYAVKSKPVFVQLEQRSLGAAVRGINIFELKRARLPVPPPQEQLSIATHLDDEARAIDRLCDEAESAIALLQERRSALISAAVTGKIDVRGVAPAAMEAA